jgi:flagellar biosynthetic protein FliP
VTLARRVLRAVVATAAVAALLGAAPLRASAQPPGDDGAGQPGVATTVTGAQGGTPETTVPVITVPAIGGVDPVEVPSVDEPRDEGTFVLQTPEGTSNAVLLLVLVTLVSVVPGLLMLTTTFPRFLIVLGLTRQALGLNTTPPNQVLAGLAAFLTLFVMGPVFSEVNDTAVQPAVRGDLTTTEALEAGWAPLRDFMLDRTRSDDLSMLYDMTGSERPAAVDDISPRFLIPAFILSELRAAFLIGFLVWVPFLLIDLIVSTVLAAMGMLMMPPVVVSLPIKLALFVLVDGWSLLAGSLLRSVA